MSVKQPMSLQKKATIFSSSVAFLLTIVKVVVGVLSGSVVVLASAIDSILDMLVSLFNLYAVRTSEKKTDELYNYGRGKIEGFASMLEGLLITVSGLFIIYKAAENFREGSGPGPSRCRRGSRVRCRRCRRAPARRPGSGAGR